MESNLLIQPTAKRNSGFPKSYPFPIVKDESKTNAGFNCIIGHIKNQCVEVTDENNMKLLFTMGFYGKGTLSRSTPKVVEDSFIAVSKVPKRKKKVCKESKKSREKQNENNEVEVVEYDDNIDENAPKKRKTDEIEVVLSDTEESEESSESSEDEASAKEKEPLQLQKDKEVLQLTLEEAFFLSYGLGCLVVKDRDQPLDLMRLWHKFCEIHPNQNFPIMYTAYHHFRSKGWVVRSGLKYGTDFVLYKDGPAFYHSSYAVIVKPVKEKDLRDITGPGGRPNLSWSALAGLNRTVSHSAKTVMILYVIKPSSISDNKISTPFCISQYKLEEVIVKRWVPSENRTDE